MELRRPTSRESSSALNNINQPATEARTYPAESERPERGTLSEHSVSPAPSQDSAHNSLLMNIGNAVTRWWTGSQVSTEESHHLNDPDKPLGHLNDLGHPLLRVSHPNDLGQPLLDRIGIVSRALEHSSVEIETQTWNAQAALEREKKPLLIQQIGTQKWNAVPKSSAEAALRSEQNSLLEQQIGLPGQVHSAMHPVQNPTTLEDDYKELLTSLQQHHSLLEQQLELLSQVHSAMHPVQNRLTTLEDDYKKLATSTDERVERGNKFLQDARTILKDLVTTTLEIANKGNLQIALPQIEREDSLTQLTKAATSLLDEANAALRREDFLTPQLAKATSLLDAANAALS